MQWGVGIELGHSGLGVFWDSLRPHTNSGRVLPSTLPENLSYPPRGVSDGTSSADAPMTLMKRSG